MKSKPFNIRMDMDLKKRIEERAIKDKRTLAAEIEYLAEVGLDEMELKDNMLANYTNLYVEHLQPVADKIDELIGEGPGGEPRDQRTG